MYQDKNFIYPVSTLKKQVERVLREESDTRNSDITLTIRMWQRFYGVNESIQLSELYDLPREDNIKRIRAKFCEEKKSWAYPSSREIAKRRGIKEDEWRVMMGYPRTEDTLNPTKKPSWMFNLPPVFDLKKLEEKRLKEAQAKLF